MRFSLLAAAGHGILLAAPLLSGAVASAAPLISVQPVGQVVCAGTNLSLVVSAVGTGTLTYQWRLNGSNLSGATGASLALNNIQPVQQGDYEVVVMDGTGGVTSDTAQVVVLFAPSILIPPQSQSAGSGGSVTFSVLANGKPPPTYQWRLNDTAIPGATNSSHTVSPVSPTTAGTYSVAISNDCGGLVSAGAVLTLTGPPIIITQPQSQSVKAGTNVTFTVAAIGSTPLSYQWCKDGVAITGATNTTLSLANVQYTAGGGYSAKVTNAFGNATSLTATLTVSAAPIIIVQPQSVTALAGGPASFTVVASGRPTLQYQWCRDGAVIAGATNATYAIANVGTADVAAYVVKVANSDGDVQSDPATLKLTLRKLQIGQAQTTNLNAGATVQVPVSLFGESAENRVTLSVAFDLNRLGFTGASSLVGGALLSVNHLAGQGLVGLDLSLPAGQTFATGSNNVIQLDFVLGTAQTQTISGLILQGTPTTNQVLGTNAAVLPSAFVNGAVILKNVSSNDFRAQTGFTEEILPVINPGSAGGSLLSLKLSFYDLGVDSLGFPIQLVNRTGLNADGSPYILLPAALVPAGQVDLNLEYSVVDRRTIPAPRVVIEFTPQTQPALPAGATNTVALLLAPRLQNGLPLLNFATVAGRSYYVQYRDGVAAQWETSFPAIPGIGGNTQWVDVGPPRTASRPLGLSPRFYRIIETQ